MQESGPVGLDLVIFGGGGAGLWLLDALIRDGYDALLLEADALGAGQTIASQGIIHGGLKYTLSGMFTRSARAIREMPLIWRRSLAGEHPPDLSKTKLRSEFCYLWQTGSLSSRVAMIGARAGLRVSPRSLTVEQRPPILAACPGTVARLDEQVIEPMSLLSDLADRHRDRILKIDAVNGLEFDLSNGGGSEGVETIRLINPDTGESLELKPRDVILTAGEGNGQLRRSIGLSSPEMQTRPLHMVMCRGDRGVGGDPGGLPLLNGHCVDGRATRLTITSTTDYAERTVWQIGGQIAERGVGMEPSELIAYAAAELRDAIPGFTLDGVEWNTYRVNRAEQASGGHRPADVHVKREGRTITAWPTKLALVPRMAGLIQDLLEAPSGGGGSDRDMIADWPRPSVALPPWERQDTWFNAD